MFSCLGKHRWSVARSQQSGRRVPCNVIRRDSLLQDTISEITVQLQEFVWRCSFLRLSFLSTVRQERNRSRRIFVEKAEKFLPVASSKWAWSAVSVCACTFLQYCCSQFAQPLPNSPAGHCALNAASQPLYSESVSWRMKWVVMAEPCECARPRGLAAPVASAAFTLWGLMCVCKQCLVLRCAWKMGLSVTRRVLWLMIFSLHSLEYWIKEQKLHRGENF